MQRQEANLNRAMSLLEVHAFKREMGMHGYGEEWRALPEGAREVIDRFNKLPKEERPQELNRLREHFCSAAFAITRKLWRVKRRSSS